ncbi:alcohol dehydrogenase catalytic domain-containing protein [Amycolatopsis sp. NBC_00345]|uniref:alcohol dehydrogenase catalytic domain-containing protein n=1 Tax=Amycolatopsis sp. NBC_00345 TaxID=2975955 RepID=UPI002E25B315
MKGVVYCGPGEVRVRDLPMPVVRDPRDVVVRVTRTAICGTDLHPYRGELPGFPAGTVLGHEFAGVVQETGAGSPFAVGDRVFASDVIACGRCRHCERGRHYQCASVSLFGYADVVGAPVDGGQAEYVRVPFADVVLAAIPVGVSDEQAVFVGDVLTTAYGAVRDAGVTAGDTVAVVGGGPVGLLGALCARQAGASRIVVADREPVRRERARSMGFEAVPPAQLSTTVRGGADRVIEAVGTDAALLTALEVTGPAACVAVAGAHHSTAMPFPTGLAFARELTIRFSVGNPIRLRAEVLALVAAGELDPVDVVSHRFALDDAAHAYREFDQRIAFKVMMHAS